MPASLLSFYSPAVLQSPIEIFCFSRQNLIGPACQFDVGQLVTGCSPANRCAAFGPGVHYGSNQPCDGVCVCVCKVRWVGVEAVPLGRAMAIGGWEL